LQEGIAGNETLVTDGCFGEQGIKDGRTKIMAGSKGIESDFFKDFPEQQFVIGNSSLIPHSGIWHSELSVPGAIKHG